MAKKYLKALVLFLFSASLSGQYTADSTYYSSGELRSVTRYKDGRKNGACFIYYQNGNLSQTVGFKDGIKEGLETTYFEDGKPEQECEYRKGKLNGQCTMYYPNGNKLFTGKFMDGYMSGERIYYNPDGSLAEGKFLNLRSDGTIERECECVNGRPEGELRFYRNGTLFLLATFRKGKPHGPAIHYQWNRQVSHIDYYYEGEQVSEQDYRMKELRDPPQYYDIPDKNKIIRPLPKVNLPEEK